MEKRYKGLIINTELHEEYNLKRKPHKDYYLKERAAECYNTTNTTKYFHESGMCFDKRVDFSTAEYYDQRVGRVKIAIGASYYSKDSKLTKFNFEEVIKELDESVFKMFLDSHKPEYVETLI